MESYEKLELIGEGTYSKVYYGRHRVSSHPVALKVIELNAEEGAPATALREIAFMRELSHPNIVKLLEVIHTERLLVLVFEHLECDLKNFLDSRSSMGKKLGSLEVKSFLFQILQGIKFCHENRILHRDLKPQNVLVASASGVLKLADFGLARGFGIPVSSFSSEVVTLWYRAPDVLLGSTNYTTSIDMWSVGCMMVELYTGRPVFPGKDNEDQLRWIFKTIGTPTAQVWPHLLPPDAMLPDWVRRLPTYPIQSLAAQFPFIEPAGIDLLVRLLDYRPSFRITSDNALNHPFFYELYANSR